MIIFSPSSARFLSRLLHSKSPIAISARKTFAPHIDLIKATLKQGVDLLKQVKSIEGMINFDLPPWASDIDFKVFVTSLLYSHYCECSKCHLVIGVSRNCMGRAVVD